MRRGDVARLLTIAAAGDNRRLDGLQGDAALEAWGAVLGDLDYEPCVRAIHEHRRTAPGVYLEPGHVRQLALVELADAHPAALDTERAALAAFVAYTGIDRAEAARRWSDEAWCNEQIDIARRGHRERAGVDL